MTFEFEIDNQVSIRLSGEDGVVTGRSEFRDSPPRYLLDYVAADGRFVQNWFLGSQIIAE